MTVKLGIMELPATQDADRVRDYLNGTIADGGLWTALGRASDHDHTGGLQGKPISVAAIPDGSITTGKLDPSVLLPYTLVDGSKPHTGQQAFNADALVRDTLYFGAKPAGVADANLKRTGANALQFSGNVGVGVAPAAWGGGRLGFQIGQTGSLSAATADATVVLGNNSYWDGASKAIINAPSFIQVFGNNGSMSMYTAPAVAAGAAQTFTTRLTVAQTGTVTLTPDVGQLSLTSASVLSLGGQDLSLQPGNVIYVQPSGHYMMPGADNTRYVGHPSYRFAAMYAAGGMITTSHVSMKENFSPLDPVACVQAVLDTQWLNFDYKKSPPPVRAEGTTDEGWAEQQTVYERTMAETAPGRKQRGYVLGSDEYRVSDLFGLSDRTGANTHADLAVVACALQNALARIAALENAS